MRAEAAAAVSVQAKAFELANQAAGTDRVGVSRKARRLLLAATKEREDHRKQSKRMKKINNESRSELAAKSCPARVSLGMIDLKKPPTKAVLTEECHVRGIH